MAVQKLALAGAGGSPGAVVKLALENEAAAIGTLLVSGTMTSDGTTPWVCPPLHPSPDGTVVSPKPSWDNRYDPELGPDLILVYWTTGGGGRWEIYDDGSGANWRSSEPVATPDLVTTWTPADTTTGTPVVTIVSLPTPQKLAL